MDSRKLLGTLDALNEGTMDSAKKKSTGPKFVGKMKGTDPASAAKDKYVGGMEESIIKELEATLQKDPEKRDLFKEFREFKEQSVAEGSEQQWVVTVGTKTGGTSHTMTFSGTKEQAIKKAVARFGTSKNPVVTAKLKQQGVAEDFSELDLAVMEGGHELVKEAPVPAQQPAQPGQQPQQQQNKPTLGADVGKQQQQQAQQSQDQAKQQADAAKQAQQQQSQLQKGVNSLKSAGAAISNAGQTVQAFNKVDANTALTPNDKNNIASAGTVLAPIMGNQQLAGKFKDLVNQASAVEKKEQQQQAQQAQQPQAAPAPGQQPQQAPAGAMK